MPSPEPRGGHAAAGISSGTMGGAVVAWPLAARAQQQDGPMRRVGVLMGFAEGDPEGQAYVAAFREGLQKLGWTDGRNISDRLWLGAGCWTLSC